MIPSLCENISHKTFPLCILFFFLWRFIVFLEFFIVFLEFFIVTRPHPILLICGAGHFCSKGHATGTAGKPLNWLLLPFFDDLQRAWSTNVFFFFFLKRFAVYCAAVLVGVSVECSHSSRPNLVLVTDSCFQGVLFARKTLEARRCGVFGFLWQAHRVASFDLPGTTKGGTERVPIFIEAKAGV